MTPWQRRQVLTDRLLRSLKPGASAADIADAQQPGLIARILPSGTIQFALRYRWQGTNRRLKLGTYSAAFGLAAARRAARAALVRVEAGDDPAGERQAARRRTHGDTFGDLAADYMERHAKPHKRTWPADARYLRAEILPVWRSRKARDITRRDVRDLVERIADRGSVISANRCLALIRKIFNHGISRDWLDANPAARLPKPGVEQSRARVLTDDEIRRLWRCLTNHPTTAEKPAPGRRRAAGDPDDPRCPVSPAHAAVLQLRLLTAQRGGEVARMRWQDLDLSDEHVGWWTIPADHTKNKQAHRVPLVGRALEIVRAQPTVDSDGRPRVYVFGDGSRGALDRAKKAPGLVAKRLGIDCRGHDLRRTAATKMAEAGIPQADIAKVLNHVEGGPRSTAIYNRYAADREKRRALEIWEWRLRALIGWDRAIDRGEPHVPARPARVVAMRGRR